MLRKVKLQYLVQLESGFIIFVFLNAPLTSIFHWGNNSLSWEISNFYDLRPFSLYSQEPMWFLSTSWYAICCFMRPVRGSGGCVIRRNGPPKPILVGGAHRPLNSLWPSFPMRRFLRNGDFWMFYNKRQPTINTGMELSEASSPNPVIHSEEIFMKAVFKNLFPKFVQNVFFRWSTLYNAFWRSCALSLVLLVVF